MAQSDSREQKGTGKAHTEKKKGPLKANGETQPEEKKLPPEMKPCPKTASPATLQVNAQGSPPGLALLQNRFLESHAAGCGITNKNSSRFRGYQSTETYAPAATQVKEQHADFEHTGRPSAEGSLGQSKEAREKKKKKQRSLKKNSCLLHHVVRHHLHPHQSDSGGGQE